MAEPFCPLPAVIVDMLARLANENLSRTERDNVCMMLEHINDATYSATKAYRNVQSRIFARRVNKHIGQ